MEALKVAVRTLPKDTSLVNSLIDLGKLYQNSYVDTAILYHSKAVKTSKEIGDRLFEGESMRQLAFSYFLKGKTDSMFTLLTKASGYATKEFEISRNEHHRIRSENLMARVNGDLALFYENKGETAKAISYYESAINKFKNTQNWKHLSANLSNLGVLYSNFGNYAKALDHFSQAYKLNEKYNFLAFKISNVIGIGVTLSRMGQPKDAVSKYEEALKVMKDLGDMRGISTTLINLAQLQMELKEYKQADSLFKEGIKICEKISNKSTLVGAYNGLAILYSTLKEYEKAEDFALKALAIAVELKNPRLRISNLVVVNELQLKLKKMSEAEIGKRELEEFLKSANTTLDQVRIHGALMKYYEVTGDSKKALEHYELYVASKDSLNSTETRKRNIREQFKFEYEKREAVAKAEFDKQQALAQSEIERRQILLERNKQSILLLEQENELKQMSLLQNEVDLKQKKIEADNQQKTIALLNKESEIRSAEARQKEETLKKQKIIIYATSIGVFLVLILLGVAIYGYRQKRKANDIITLQKHEVEKQKEAVEEHKHIIEEKQKEIVDSINYAKRIQFTLLAHDQFLKDNIKEHFILFHPKDIVSGDFYWATKHNDKFYLAVCDSTGHGVPGAFMSLLNIGFLSEAINEKGLEKPNEVFDYVREKLTQTVSKDGQKDGFDGILLCFDQRSKAITYAAANNAPILIQAGQLTEMGSDRMPVGVGERKEKFKLHRIEAMPGDMLYLYTDGYADQFGGPKGKKFKYKQLNELLISFHSRSLELQNSELIKEFEKWKGDLEQVDDVTVIGIKI